MATDVAGGPVVLDLRKTRNKLVDDVDRGAKRWPPQQSLQQRGILSEPRAAAETTAWLESPNVGTPCRKGLFGRVSRTVDENSSGGAGTEVKNEPGGAVLLPLHFEHLHAAADRSTEDRRPGLEVKVGRKAARTGISEEFFS